MPSEAAFDWISDQLRRDGNFAATIANSSLYQECGRSSDALDAVAELVEPIVRTAVGRALAAQEARHRREVIEARIDAIENFDGWTSFEWVKEMRAKLDALEAKP